MNKNELVAAVAEKADLSSKEAGSAVTAVFDIIQTAMAKGEDIRLVGFGTFGVAHRKASKGRTLRPARKSTLRLAMFRSSLPAKR